MVVRVDGQNWNAKYSGNIRPVVGEKVKVLAIKGLNLLIEPAKKS